MKKILIVDDAMFMRSSLKLILQRNDFEVVGEAESGHEAVRKYDQIRPDIVTMDITMPDMDGLEALKAIRKIDNQAQIVMISAAGKESAVREAILNGAVNFIMKPFKEDQVLEVLNRIK